MAMATIAVATTLSSFIAYERRVYWFRENDVGRVHAVRLHVSAIDVGYSDVALFRIAGLADSFRGLLIAHLAISLPLAGVAAWGFFKSMPFDLRKRQWWTAVPSSALHQGGSFPLSAPA